MAIFLKDNIPPTPKEGLCCPRCNGKRIIQGQEIKDSDGSPSSLAIKILTGEKKFFGLADEFEYAWVYVNLCVDCGFIDWFMKKEDAEALWAIYQKSKG